MAVRLCTSLAEIDAGQWNALNADNNPFLRYEFLGALESHGCLGEEWGWLPRHVLMFEGAKLVAAVPMYEKTNSYGEFVFDWAWADAWQRAGLQYYPKLVIAVPYTPISGQRILLHPDYATRGEELGRELIEWIGDYARKQRYSSVHCLFAPEAQIRWCESAGWHPRYDCQFHWHNRDGTPYRDFEDFLATLSSAKRKKIRRERRRVGEAAIRIEILSGEQATATHWQWFHHFYCDTFFRRGGYPTLTREFFANIGSTMGEQVLLLFAFAPGEDVPVAAALCFRNQDTLYGRHWGCREDYHSLHFELCYYQGIDYCIGHGLAHFEPGAQGEHKIRRGFVPTLTRSAHWIADPRFDQVIARHLLQEREGVEHYMQELNDHLPYRQDHGETGPGEKSGV